MKKYSDDQIEMQRVGMSRRDMLKSVGCGAAGLIAAPHLLAGAPARASLSSYTPRPVWSYPLSSNYQPQRTQYAFASGTIVVTTVIASEGGSHSEGVIFSLDTQTSTVRWLTNHPESSFGMPIAGDGVIYVEQSYEDGGALVGQINAATGEFMGSVDLAEPLAGDLTLAGDTLIYVTRDGSVGAIPTSFRTVSWTYSSGESITGGTPRPVVSKGTVIVMINETLHALDLQTGQLRWRYSAGAIAAFELSIGAGLVYLATANSNTLQAVDIATGSAKWKLPASNDQLSAPVYYNGVVYVGDSVGRFSAVNADTGVHLWQTQVNGALVSSEFFFEDGIAYFTAGDGRTYAVDCQTNGQDIVSYTPPGFADTVIAIESGVCYFADDDPATIRAVDLAGLVHQFFCESELMVEDYARNAITGKTQGQSTSFRTHIQLVDPVKNPRANKSVKVWASEPVTITSGGRSFAIDAQQTEKSAWLQTDALGELSIVSTAESITTPALYLWGSFMDVQEAIVIYPDYDTLGKLASVQGTDFQNAKAYDGTSMLPSTFNSTDTAALASAVRGAIGGVGHTLTQKQNRKSGPGVTAISYLAYPASTPNMIYQPIAGAASRSYVSGAISNWTAEFTSTGITFNPGTTNQHQEPPGSLWGDFTDFVNDVVKGLERIAKIAWSKVENVVNTIVTGLTKAYKFTIDTVEKAAAVVMGALKTIVNDLKKVVEWLSYLFEWDDILATKDQLKSLAQNGFRNLEAWVDNQIGSDLNAVHGFFQTFKASIGTNLTKAAQTFGGTSLQSRQRNNNNPQAVYGAGGARSYAKSRWLMQKFKDNAGQASVGSSAPPSVGSDPIVSVMGQLITDVSGIINGSESFRAIPQDIKNVFTDFSLLVTDPSDFVTKSFGDIILLIKDALELLVQFTDAVVEAVLKALRAIIDAVIAMATQPINIPVVSDLYELITGSSLSILDLCCLIIAVPTTIIRKALNGKASSGSALGVASVQDVGLLLSLAAYAVVDPGMDITNRALPWKYFYLGLVLMVEGLSFPSDFETNSNGVYVFYVATAFPLILTGVDIAFSRVGGSEGWDVLGPLIDVFYGIAMVGASFVLGMTYQQFSGNNYLTMFQNIFSFVPFLFKPLGIGGGATKTALALIDGVCDVSAFFLDGAQVLA